MNYKLLFIIVLFVDVTSACNSNPKKETPQAENQLLTFLKEELKIDINDSIQHFILIPSFGCYGCKEGVVRAWLSEFSEEFKVVVASRKIIFDYKAVLPPHDNCYVDSTGMLDRLNIRLASFTLATINNRWEIVRKEAFDTSDDESIILASYLNKGIYN